MRLFHCAPPSPALPLRVLMGRKASRVIWCPYAAGCAAPRETGKPLGIVVDGVRGYNGKATANTPGSLTFPRPWDGR